MIGKLTEFRDSLNQTRRRVRLLEEVNQERGCIENFCRHRISQPSRNTLTRHGLFRNDCGYGVYGMARRIALCKAFMGEAPLRDRRICGKLSRRQIASGA